MVLDAAFLLGGVAIAGLVQGMLGTAAVGHFARRRAVPASARPSVTVLKPLHGNEPLLEDALASLCRQDYPVFQIVFGVQDHADPALAVVARLRLRFPACDIAVVVDGTPHGVNHKIANLLNMFPAAKRDVLVIADSDVHAAPDYLARLVDTLAQPGVGLVTTLYTGLPATRTLPGLLGASAITHGFLPGALLARAMGRQDCLGATMALRRDTLAAVGGLAALADHLADDNHLGVLVRRSGLQVRLADTVPATTVPETDLPSLFRHELRWARTIKALVPVQFLLSSIQYPLVWVLLALLASDCAVWTVGLLGIAWAVRAAGIWYMDHVLARLPSCVHAGLASRAAIWLLPLRDILSLIVMIASCFGNNVEWRGHWIPARRTPATPSFGPGTESI